SADGAEALSCDRCCSSLVRARGGSSNLRRPAVCRQSEQPTAGPEVKGAGLRWRSVWPNSENPVVAASRVSSSIAVTRADLHAAARPNSDVSKPAVADEERVVDQRYCCAVDGKAHEASTQRRDNHVPTTTGGVRNERRAGRSSMKDERRIHVPWIGGLSSGVRPT